MPYDHCGHGEPLAGPAEEPLKHCSVEEQKPHPVVLLHDGHLPNASLEEQAGKRNKGRIKG